MINAVKQSMNTKLSWDKFFPEKLVYNKITKIPNNDHQA